MSKLRLGTLICAVVASISLFYGFSKSNKAAIIIGIVVIIVGLIIRVLRFLYRD
jgi:hypothetical protein